VVVTVFIVDIILSFADGKISPSRTFSTVFSSHFSFVLRASPPSASLFHLFLCREIETKKQRREERRTKRKQPANTFSGQSVIFISETFAPFVRNPERTLQSSSSHLQILFLFTFAAAEVGSCSRPILSPRTFRSCLSAISLDRETCDEVRESVPARIQYPRYKTRHHQN